MKNLILKSLLPSWKFFDHFHWAPELHYKVAFVESEFSDWRLCLKRPSRNPGSLFLNPRGNLHHACNTAVEKLVLEASQNPQAIESSVAYGIVKNIVRYQIQADQGYRQAFSYQFKILARTSKEPASEILISSIHEAL